MTVQRNISFDDETFAKIEAWASSPEQKRTLSNAVCALCVQALLKYAEQKEE
jgi:hypothetical protein